MASDFDRDDLFGDFDDDENGFDDFDDFDDDSELGLDDDSSFDDDFGFDGDLGLDDDDEGLSFEEDFDDFDEFDPPSPSAGGGSGGSRPSPVFILLAVVFIVILLGGLALILYLAVIRPASPTQLTSTSVVMTNDAVGVQVAASETQSKIELDLTMTADAWTDTPSPTFTPTDIPPPTEDTSLTLTAEFEATRGAADAFAEETSIAATENMINTLNPPEVVSATPVLPTAIGAVTDVSEVGTPLAGGATTTTMPSTGVPPDISAVQMTATALATILAPPPVGSAEATTDPNIGGGSVTPSGTDPTATVSIVDNGSGGGGNLPNTGLFDDIFGGNPATIFFAAFGLLGVIVISRGIRSNRKRK